MDKIILIKTMVGTRIHIEILTEMVRVILMKELIRTHIQILMGIHMVGKATRNIRMLITKHMKESVRGIKKEKKCFDNIIKTSRKWPKKNLTT